MRWDALIPTSSYALVVTYASYRDCPDLLTTTGKPRLNAVINTQQPVLGIEFFSVAPDKRRAKCMQVTSWKGRRKKDRPTCDAAARNESYFSFANTTLSRSLFLLSNCFFVCLRSFSSRRLMALSSSFLISPAFFTTLGICLWRLIRLISGCENITR